MINYIFAALLLLIALLTVVVSKTYFSVPVVELRRRAQYGETLASQLYRAVAYDSSLRGLLLVIITFCSAGSFVLLVRQASVGISLLVVITSLWLVFFWLPKSRVTAVGARLTVLVTPAIAWLLNYLHPAFSHGSRLVGVKTTVAHTGLYERSDLLELIARQQLQSDNRLNSEELEIVQHALHFADRKVADVLTPRKQIKIINADDTVGPILIDELHRTGQEAALVRETAKGPIIGFLQFKKFSLNSNGKVRDIMEPSVYYLHENDSLSEALHAFFVTNQSLFLVVNNAEDNVGIITVQTMLEELLGHVPGDDFDQYANLTAVASRHDKPKPPKPETDIDEVVEV